jgi:hypothetical protein
VGEAHRTGDRLGVLPGAGGGLFAFRPFWHNTAELSAFGLCGVCCVCCRALRAARLVLVPNDLQLLLATGLWLSGHGSRGPRATACCVERGWGGACGMKRTSVVSMRAMGLSSS